LRTTSNVWDTQTFMRILATLALACAALHSQAVEKFSYDVEWRLVTAGRTELTWEQGSGGFKGQLAVRSAGLVSRLFKVNDIYDASGSHDLCATETRLQAEEGGRKRDTVVQWKGTKSHYVERDLLKNQVALEKDLDVPPCVHDVLAALAKLRTLRTLGPGQTATLPISDGKKFVMARVDGQERERVSTKLGQFQTIRYEAFLFNEVLFKRSARLLIWISDDARRIPVQVQVRMRIHIGNVTFQLDKVEPPVEGLKK